MPVKGIEDKYLLPIIDIPLFVAARSNLFPHISWITVLSFPTSCLDSESEVCIIFM